MEHDDAVYREFRARYGPLLERLNDVEWTRREARSRMLTVHPEMDHELLDRALAEMSWRSELRREDPLGGVVISCSLLLAVNDLFDLGEDPEYAVTLLERAIFQEMSAFMNLHGISDEAAAHILSRLAASNRFLAEYPRTTLTQEEYRGFLRDIPEYLRELSAAKDGRWPVSDALIRERIGEGSWTRALLAVGMSPEERYAADGTDLIPEYTEARFRSAMADFFTFCIRTDRIPHALLYGRWAASGSRSRVPRPNLATVRHQFGSWSQAIAHGRELINSSDPAQADPRYEEHWVGPWTQPTPVVSPSGGRAAWSVSSWTDRGIGVVGHLRAEPGETSEADAEAAWEELVGEIAQAVRDLPWNHFLTVEYETGNNLDEAPFAQAFTGPAGVEVTLVSERFLPAIVWPIDDAHLQRTGWTAPDESQPHWRQGRLEPEAAARTLVDGLRHGRDCSDPYSFRWGSGAVYAEGEQRAETDLRR
ncbi:TY-Chap domain-containing protein [Rothia kristinae]|uniref:TY-Chap domain-containing protein n=1 Tax=Rothia kristinae TaxID=37923 RepID=UPI0021A829B4|nr:hypothetical protein [Rothia kristinae]MCT2242669.1 hypothetical protein [Rothia kristinae]